MSHADPSPARFSFDESEQLDEYHSLSWLAVAALVLGTASCTVLLSVRLCVIPLLGLVLAIAALRSIAKHEPRLVGRRAALWGLALAAMFGAWGVTQDVVRQALIFRQARRHAFEWLELVQAGRIAEADQLHHPQESRQPPGTPLNVHYKKDSDARKRREEFFIQPALKKLTADGRQATIRFVGDESLISETIGGVPTEFVTQRFALDYAEDGRPQSLVFLITLNRKYYHDAGESRWDVRDVALPLPKKS